MGLDYRDIYFMSTDKIKLHGWFLPSKGEVAGTVLFLHGNAENISTHIYSVAWLPEQGFNVFLFDYRGYGSSPGKPDMEGVHDDADKALEYLAKHSDIDSHGVIVLGQSLGGAIGIYLAAHSVYADRIKALIVESAFSGYRRIIRDKLAGLWITWPLQWPLSYMVSDQYNPLEAMAKIAPKPLLIIHGTDDLIVSVYHARLLFQAANRPKELWIVSGGRHIAAFNQIQYRERLLSFLKKSIPVLNHQH